MPDRDGTRSLPGLHIGALGILALAAGFATGGPDAVGGVVFGGVCLAAAAVILCRQAPARPDSEPPDDTGPPAVTDVDHRGD